MSIDNKLRQIIQIKSDIKDAIIAKGVEVDTSLPFSQYASKIGKISGGGQVELPFVQPILTSNKDIGKSDFAVGSNIPQFHNPDCGIYMGFDEDDNTFFHSTQNNTSGDIIIYNPNKLNLKKLTIKNQNVGSFTRQSRSGAVYGSNNNFTWFKIANYSFNTGTETYTIDLSMNDKFFYYYKWHTDGTLGDSYFTFTQCDLTGTVISEQVPTLVDIKQIGNPSFYINGVVDDFSDNNYFTMNNYENIDLYFLCNTVSNSSDVLVGFKDGQYWLGNDRGYIGGYLGASRQSSFKLEPRTNYWICCSVRENTLNVYGLLDNGYTKETVPKITESLWTKALSDVPISKNNTYILCKNVNATSQYWRGSVDFLNSFGEYNGETIWTPLIIE